MLIVSKGGRGKSGTDQNLSLMRPAMLRSLLLSSALLLPAHLLSAPMAYSAEAILAGGCFWCIEKDFEKVDGVTNVISGYTGGKSANPTYKNHGKTGHREAVKITYDANKISYEKLLDIFWRTVDPTDGGGQFCDRGFSYSTAVYALNDAQLKSAEISKRETAAQLGKTIVTEITLASKFTPSEDYHQNYYKKNPIRYKFYRTSCGRDRGVKALWGNQAYRGVKGH